MTAAVDSFKKRAVAVGAEVEHVENESQALEFIVGVLLHAGIADLPGSYAVWAECPMIDSAHRGQLNSRTPGIRFDVTRENAAQAKVGISQMDWALADTGKLVQIAEEIDKRLVSTLPPIHIAILPTPRILPGLSSALARLDPTKIHYISLITGPSRTADIERVLTIGVHGPSRLIIVLVDNTAVAL